MSRVNLEASNEATPVRANGTRGSRGGGRWPVAIIGAGPYGLSLAAHMSHLGIEARVLGDPMGGWRHHMPSGMFLKSAASASNLSAPVPGFTLQDFCIESRLAPLDDSQPVPIDLFVRYGLWFQANLVPTVEPERLSRLARAGRTFDLTLESGEEFHAQTVVAATGLVSFAHLPSELSALAPDGPSTDGPVSHTFQHRDLSQLAGKEVAVIGGGQSALESAALLHESGADVHVVVRSPELVYATPPTDAGDGQLHRLVKPPSPLGPGWSLFGFSQAPAAFRHLPAAARLRLVKTVLGPFGAWWLRDRVEGRVDIRTGQRIRKASLTGSRVALQLDDLTGHRHDLSVDHVIAATGYHVDVDRLSFVDPGLRAQVRRVGRSPQLTTRFESSVPGLFFTGLAAAATFGPVLRFVCGSDFASRLVGSGVARRVSRRLP